MTAAKLRLAQAAMGQPGTKVGELCAELGITRQTLYRHVNPNGQLRPDGEKLLRKARGGCIPTEADAGFDSGMMNRTMNRGDESHC
jgi:hypothetical protein